MLWFKGHTENALSSLHRKVCSVGHAEHMETLWNEQYCHLLVPQPTSTGDCRTPNTGLQEYTVYIYIYISVSINIFFQCIAFVSVLNIKMYFLLTAQAQSFCYLTNLYIKNMDCLGFVLNVKENFHLRFSSDHLESLGQLTPTRKQAADLGITSAIAVRPCFCKGTVNAL